MERLNNSGRESRKRQKLLQVQVRSLVEERADFLAQLQDQHREIIALRKRLGIAEKENEDLSKFPVSLSIEIQKFRIDHTFLCRKKMIRIGHASPPLN